MRPALFWIGLVLVLTVPNALIVKKETIARRGERVYLELAPVDPRSLIQGDYMDLRYRLNRELDATKHDEWPTRGRVVLRLDARGVGEFARHEREGGKTASGEQLLRYRQRGYRFLLGVESFFFQEGQGQVFATARYGELRVLEDGSGVLVALCDENLKRLGTAKR